MTVSGIPGSLHWLRGWHVLPAEEQSCTSRYILPNRQPAVLLLKKQYWCSSTSVQVQSHMRLQLSTCMLTASHCLTTQGLLPGGNTLLTYKIGDVCKAKSQEGPWRCSKIAKPANAACMQFQGRMGVPFSEHPGKILRRATIGA